MREVFKYGIPRATLQRHLRSESCKKKLKRLSAVFTPKQEVELFEYIFQIVDKLNGLSREEFFATRLSVCPKNARKPEPTSIARARRFNKPQVYRFFDLLEEQIEKYDTDTTRLYNMDETGIQTSSCQS